ncbi:hypothetical protein VOLCADRAFT_95970 [Volvox carteri f. nagariensis]|uniref:Uncharacterized protein n=1 Tax=Volvox carteri f. nagariensis TaxID=3068 RepID=D8U8V4_VOLCA|nr:uncharacterized protein VOLCADRAFT_95970 [Volvox carteri f. nagariensis]EFJ43814.1 hypothetical protein VOLCADRAFT_95970 [Volvox carteri f. nagariensis]|eukprot:XP_002955060.1 hypothetical protein VOLCADRAFT_95970 [Volvox carteri f. nagariensis]
MVRTDDQEHMEELNKIAQDKFGKSFEELDAHQRIQVGGVKGGHARGGHSADPDRAPPPPEVKLYRQNGARTMPGVDSVRWLFLAVEDDRMLHDGHRGGFPTSYGQMGSPLGPGLKYLTQ